MFRTRTGTRIGTGVGALGWPQLTVQNDATSYDTEIGALGTALDGAGIGRFVDRQRRRDVGDRDRCCTARPRSR